ncbi:MAG: AAA family ATPase [Betaproteobacteria bacterium]|nr:MAG: AAA family ATPase [Betaproteobacteria bacterium]
MQTQDGVDSLRKTVNGLPVASLETTLKDLAAVASDLKGDAVPDILLVDLALEDRTQVDLLARIIGDHKPNMAVIATAERASLDGIRSLMRIGVADFVPQPLTAIDLGNALDSAMAKSAHGNEHSDARGQVVSFIRSCGGVGATTLAIQTAMELAGIGKRNHSVALLDLDLQFGDVGLSLDIPERGGLPQILESPTRLDDDFLNGSMSMHQSGVQILGAPKDIVPLNALRPETAVRLVTIAQNAYEYVVCDMPHAWTGWTGSVLRASDRIVLVTEPSVPALQRSRRLLDLMDRQALRHAPVSIVANGVDTGWGWGSRRKQAEEALGRPFDFVVRADQQTAREARDRGVPLREVRSGSPIIKDVRCVVEELRKRMTAEPAGLAKSA